MQKYRSLVLPIAIVLGLIFHEWCAILMVIVPYVIFAILLFNFAAVDFKKLRLSWLDLWLLLFQIVVSVGGYALLRLMGFSEMVAEGMLVGVLCPVAASVAVIACMLGANRETVTTYMIIDNLMVALAAPIVFSFVGVQQSMPFVDSFLLIINKIAPIIALPFFVALFCRYCCVPVVRVLNRYKIVSFYLWAVALFITLGRTIDFMFLHWADHWHNILLIGGSSVLMCVVQFAFGRWLGHKYGDTIAGGQLLGQKNTAIGIWMANTYLHPLSSVFPALYSICQNLYNSYQLYRKK